MPRLSRRGNHDNIKVYRPQGARYADGGGKVYFSAQNYPIAKSICIELAVRDAMQNFYIEFGEGPQGDFIVESSVVGVNITARAIELEVR